MPDQEPNEEDHKEAPEEHEEAVDGDLEYPSVFEGEIGQLYQEDLVALRLRPLQVHKTMPLDVQKATDSDLAAEYYRCYGHEQHLARCNQVIEALYQRYEAKLYTYLLAVTKNDATANDIFQEVWLLVVDSESGLAVRIAEVQAKKQEFEFWPYLRMIARNKWYDHLRRCNRRNETTLDTTEDDEAPFQPKADPSWQPEEQIQALYNAQLTTECLEQVVDAIEKLPWVQQQTIVLRYCIGLRLNETAQAQGITLNGVRSRLRSAKAKLKPILIKCKEKGDLPFYKPKRGNNSDNDTQE